MGAHFKNEGCSTADALRAIVFACGYRERSTAEIRSRLSDKGFDSHIIEEAISKAVSFGYINDQRFKESLIRMRMSQGKGIYGIRKELEQHGCGVCDDDYSLDQLSDFLEISDSDELKRAICFLQRKPPRAKNVLHASCSKLVRNGYSINIATKAAFDFVRQSSASQD